MSKLVGPLKVDESFFIAANKTQAKTNGKEEKVYSRSGRYLVYCDKRHLSGLYALFPLLNANYSLRTFDDPPPWESEAVLLISHKQACTQKAYYVEAVRRRAVAATISSADVIVAATGGDGVNHTPRWIHEMRWDDKNVQFKSAAGRPLLVDIGAEIFWRRAESERPCNTVDVWLFRSKIMPRNGCIVASFLHGFKNIYTIGHPDSKGIKTQMELPTHTDAHTVAVDAKDGSNYAHLVNNIPVIPTNNRSKFCSMLVIAVMKRQFYDIDALVRWAFFTLISEYKECDDIGPLRKSLPDLPNKHCGDTSFFNNLECMRNYKFSITMENMGAESYVTEKVLNGMLANTVPVYYGAPDASDYINIKRFVWCNVSQDVMARMRSFFVHHPNQSRKQRTFSFNTSNPNPTDRELIEWATRFLRPHLASCVKRVIDLDQDDEAFEAVLREPFTPSRAVALGTSFARGFDDVFRGLNSAV